MMKGLIPVFSPRCQQVDPARLASPRPEMIVWFLVGNEGMDYGDNYWGRI